MTRKCENCIHEKVCGVLFPNNCPFYCEEPKHEELTLEKAIDFLTEIGWLPEHDRILTDRPHGKWVDVTEYCGEFRCSACNFLCVTNIYRFCPNCGSDNRPRKHGCSFADEECKNNPCKDCGLKEGE